MIEWFSSSSRSEPKYASGDDGATFIDDCPETPAPLFVLRAFKTAIFGTPKPIEYKTLQQELSQPTGQIIAKNLKAEQNPEECDLDSRHKSAEVAATSQENCVMRDPALRDRHDQYASPTKGILLTPGTAATRRKTVSFSAQKGFAESAKSSDKSIRSDYKPAPTIKNDTERLSDVPRKQSALTKTLIELSTKRLSPPIGGGKILESENHDLSIEKVGQKGAIEQAGKSDAVANLTLDLNQPSSQSGQHWKAEYDEFHKKSTREMRKLIQHGQNVKSYAAKKDSEAANLNEKLQKELAKVARMETKVSKMAKQLRMTAEQNPHVHSEQARLVGELAQQTAMTVRYQKKAEHYRRAIQRLPCDINIDNEPSLLNELSLSEQKDSGDHFPMKSMQVELDHLQEIASTAEKKVARLDDENMRLKRSLARVKEEMATYDMRRRAKEERLKRRDERHKASKVSCEAELAKLKEEYEMLLRNSSGQEKPSQLEIQPTSNRLPSTDEDDVSRQRDPKEYQHTIGQKLVRRSSNSPRKQRLQKSVVDVWTAESVSELPVLEQNATFPSVTHEDHGSRQALQELHFNHPASTAHPLASEIIETSAQPVGENVGPDARSISQQDIAKSPVATALVRQRLSESTIGRSASLLGSRVGSRTSTMGTARTSSLSAERTAAAKARLAERKKSGEKKKSLQDANVGSLR